VKDSSLVSHGPGYCVAGSRRGPNDQVMERMDEEPQDSEIISRVIRGDVNAFELLVGRYRALVFSIVLKHVPAEKAEDVAQDAFLEAFRSLSSFAEKSPFLHWLARITVRCCYDFWRGHRHREIPVSSLSEDSEEWLDQVLAARSREVFEREASRREASEVLAYALGKLSPEDRMVLTLVHLDGHPVKEAAELLGWSVVSVKVRAHRSRQKLRKIISNLLDGRRGEA